MDEAAKLSDRVGIVDHGVLLALDTPTALVSRLPGSATVDLTVTGAEPDRLRERLAAVRGTAGAEVLSGGEGQDAAPTRLRLRVEGEAGAAAAGPARGGDARRAATSSTSRSASPPSRTSSST